TGPAQFVGYFKRPEFTAEAHTQDGWFRTGDRATLDSDGYVAITGRSKDVIIRGGENIPVAEVENVLFAHPKIAGVAIVGMPDRLSLKGRVALVAGASRGIGRAIALALGAAGADVACCARSLEDLEQTAEKIRHLGSRAGGFTMDVMQGTEVDRAVRQIEA